MSIFLANHCDEFNQLLALELIKDGLPIKAILSDNLGFFADKKVPKDVVMLNIYDYYYKDSIHKLNQHSTPALNNADIKNYLELEDLFLKISDRLCFRPISVHDRLELYHELLRYWLYFFDQHNFSMVVFSQTPHTGFDNIIYYIAKQRKIPIVIVSPTAISDRVMLRTDYMSNEKVPADFKRDLRRKALAPLIDIKLREAIYTDGPWMKIGKQINATAIKNKQGSVVMRVVTRLLQRLLSDPLDVFTELTRRTKNSGFVFSGYFTDFSAFLVSCYYYFQKKNLADYYKSLCVTKVDLKKKFVFFALHYQPERTTLPEGGVFESQLLALTILSQSVPKNWLIYVKDHPRQLSFNDVRTNAFRSKRFYRSVSELPNVKVIPIEFGSSILIDSCQFTASVQGSAGWEGMLRKKPALAFASPWYGACNSCFQADSVRDCKLSIPKMMEKTKQEVEEDVLRFLLYTQDQLIISALIHSAAKISKVKYETLLKNLAQSIESFYEKSK